MLIKTVLSTKVFHFRALSWLLGQFWLAAVVILIVVFQPEIRAALAQLGSHRWNRALFSLEDDCISELMDAIAECSRRQIGALIVVEQTVGLRTYIETGTLINAQVTKELLVSIFTPRTPLHDGAVIIQHDRVSAAGCVLPLSNEPVVSKILGTRHRAAIGLSEISDAFIIVVSEETGKVSLAYKGRLDEINDLSELQKMLQAYYHQRSRSMFA